MIEAILLLIAASLCRLVFLVSSLRDYSIAQVKLLDLVTRNQASIASRLDRISPEIRNLHGALKNIKVK